MPRYGPGMASAAGAGGGVAVVVGATGALGGAVAARLRDEGLTVVGVARAGAECAADIGSDDAMPAIADAVAVAGGGPVRMVVQAAGLPPTGPCTRSSRRRWAGRWR